MCHTLQLEYHHQKSYCKYPKIQKSTVKLNYLNHWSDLVRVEIHILTFSVAKFQMHPHIKALFNVQ